jgi:hypothetical protein
MKDIFKFIIGVLIFIWCLPILYISLLVVLWEWEGDCFRTALESIEKLIIDIVGRD